MVSATPAASLLPVLLEAEARNQARLGGMEALPLSFFCRPAEEVGPDLVGCRLVKRQADGGLLWGVIVETEAYSMRYVVQLPLGLIDTSGVM